MKRRKKELGIYNILGMGKIHIAKIMAWETFFSALHKKAVRIKQKDTYKHTYDDHSKEKNLGSIIF